jgi:hypothetical protein
MKTESVESLAFTAGSLTKATDVARQAVDLAIKTGALKATKSGRRWIILREDAIAWLKRCREQGEIPSPISQADREKLAELNRMRRGQAAA